MADFKADLFLALAKTADEHKLIKSKNFSFEKPEEFEGADFGPTGKAEIEGFKNALFMMFMLRAREYMIHPKYAAGAKKAKRTRTTFGMTIMDEDVHGTKTSLAPLFEDNGSVGKVGIEGVIGHRIDGYHLDNKALSEIAHKLFIEKAKDEPPLVRLACTLT